MGPRLLPRRTDAHTPGIKIEHRTRGAPDRACPFFSPIEAKSCIVSLRALVILISEEQKIGSSRGFMGMPLILVGFLVERGCSKLYAEKRVLRCVLSTRVQESFMWSVTWSGFRSNDLEIWPPACLCFTAQKIT